MTNEANGKDVGRISTCLGKTANEKGMGGVTDPLRGLFKKGGGGLVLINTRLYCDIAVTLLAWS